MHKLSKSVSRSQVSSRFELLQWISKMLDKQYSKFEELKDGVSYCQLISKLHPNLLQMYKVKMHPLNEYDILHNYSQLQHALKAINAKNPMSVDKLVKGYFQEHYELLKFLKSYYDEKSAPNSNDFDSVGSRSNSQLALQHKRLERKRNVSANEHNSLLYQHSNDLAQKLADAKQQVQELVQERNFYYSKLVEVQMACVGHTSNPIIKSIQAIINDVKKSHQNWEHDSIVESD